MLSPEKEIKKPCKHYLATSSSSEELIVATLAPCKIISIPSILMQPELWSEAQSCSVASSMTVK